MGKVVSVLPDQKVAELMRMCVLSAGASPLVQDNIVGLAAAALAEGGWPEAVVQHHVPDARERLEFWIRDFLQKNKKKKDETDEG